jgi:hypothetical protein
MSGVFCPGIDGVAGLAKLVNCICRYVSQAAIIVNIIFLLAIKSIHKKKWLIVPLSIAVDDAYCHPKL